MTEAILNKYGSDFNIGCEQNCLDEKDLSHMGQMPTYATYLSLLSVRRPILNLVPRVSHLNAWGERGETLVGSGHVSPRIWEMTIYPMKGGAA